MSVLMWVLIGLACWSALSLPVALVIGRAFAAAGVATPDSTEEDSPSGVPGFPHLA